jgi:hypothetical protein
MFTLYRMGAGGLGAYANMKTLLSVAAIVGLSMEPALVLMVQAAPALAQAPPALAHRHWKRGDTLPAAALAAGPSVHTAPQHLRRPPNGYGWFAMDGQFVLASLSSGLILEVVD